MHIPWHKVLQITKEHSFLSEFSNFENTKPDKIVFEENKSFERGQKRVAEYLRGVLILIFSSFLVFCYLRMLS